MGGDRTVTFLGALLSFRHCTVCCHCRYVRHGAHNPPATRCSSPCHTCPPYPRTPVPPCARCPTRTAAPRRPGSVDVPHLHRLDGRRGRDQDEHGVRRGRPRGRKVLRKVKHRGEPWQPHQPRCSLVCRTVCRVMLAGPMHATCSLPRGSKVCLLIFPPPPSPTSLSSLPHISVSPASIQVAASCRPRRYQCCPC